MVCTFSLDSSPKTSATKHAHLLTKETMDMCSTPTRRNGNRFMLGTNMINDDSPVLSQESINISWKWNNEGTPIRPSKQRRSKANISARREPLDRLTSKKNNGDNQNGMETVTSGTMSPNLTDRETHSPKGLYKFQEEMRKITESGSSCDSRNDNVNYDKSGTEADTGYPDSRLAQANVNSNARHISDNFNVQMMMETDEEATASSQNQKHGIDDALADDLLNDSDFDQILLTCKMPEQNVAASETNVNQTSVNQTSVKKASSAPEIKASDGSNSSGSNWNLIDDDCFDDLVKDFDFEIPADSLNTSGKFTRHKSMPQQPQTPSSTSSTKPIQTHSSHHAGNNSYLNRKSFTRHESMPITNSSMKRPPNTNNNIGAVYGRQNSGMHISSRKNIHHHPIIDSVFVVVLNVKIILFFFLSRFFSSSRFFINTNGKKVYIRRNCRKTSKSH